MKGQDLLFDFYSDSFRRTLGVDFKNIDTKKHLHIEDYLADRSSTNYTETLLKLKNYRNNLSPRAKTASLIEYLKTSKQPPRRLLDFGCGSGATLGVLIDFFRSIEVAIGVDTDPDAILMESLGKAGDRVQIYSDGTVLKETSFDLILTIHTLHHVGRDQQEIILAELADALAPNGILYLVEDSWSVEDEHNAPQNSFGKRFFELNDDEKIALFTANDFWSNTWCYGKHWKDERLFYRTAESWINLLAELDLTIKQVTTKGFDLNRLHGVPSLSVIAQRATPT